MSLTKTARIEIIDALRGIALAGIVICHMLENFIAGPTPESFNEAVHPSIVDMIIDGLVFFFLRGKFIALFSFLFGLSFFIQMDNGAKKNVAFGGRFLWRLTILFVIGYVHSLFYRGDILTIYALLGILLVPFYRLSNTAVLGLAALLFLGLGRYLIFFVTQGDSFWGGEIIMDTTAPKIVAYYETLKLGGLLEVFEANAVEGHMGKLEFQFNIFGRGYFTFAFFLVGLFIGRTDFFRRYKEDKRFTKKIFIWSSVTFVLALALTAATFLSMGDTITFDNWVAMLGLTGMDLANTAMTFIYITLFIMLYLRTKTEKWLSQFAPYGRMALTNYFFQSLLGTFLFFGWGLGLIGELRQLYTFLMALLIIVLQIILSTVWLKYFKYGPLEWFWRSLTFFKIFSLLREKPIKEKPMVL